jgi:hypothetical protein
MNQPNDGPMLKSFRETLIDNVEDLKSPSESDIDNLAYTADDGNRSSIGAGHRGVLRASVPTLGIVLSKLRPSVMTGLALPEKNLAFSRRSTIQL